jgi:glycosyltransferase involved in cell wall biosynthesis
MKLFVISHSYSGDGASQMLLSAASHWTKNLGWQVDAVIVPGMSLESHQAIVDSGMRPIERAHFGAKYDLVVINCIKNIHFIDFIFPHVPIVLWAHEAETILKSASIAQEKWENWFAKVALLIFQTEPQAKLYKRYLHNVGSDKVTIIPNGIPPVNVSPEEVNDCDKTFRIVNVGKLTPLKAQSDLIRVVSRLSGEYLLHCEFIGDAQYLPQLDKRVQEKLSQNPELFKLSGLLSRDRALASVAKADLFCFPSLSESFGLAPLEAVLLGVPVILADLEAYKAIGWVSGENCLTFPAGDKRGLQSAIETMINNPDLRKTIANNGMLLAKQYGIDEFLSKISETILKLSGQ